MRLAPAFIDVGGRQWRLHTGGKGPALLLLHRAPLDGRSLLPLAQSLAAGWRVVAPDLPGYGGTDPLRGERDLDGYVAALEELLAALQVERAAVIGQREGGVLALALAARHPRRIASVATLGPLGGAAQGIEPEQRLPDATPQWNGQHLAALWAYLREEASFAPWFERRAAARILGGLPAPDELQRRLVALLSSPSQGRDYADLIHAADLSAPALEQLRSEVPVPVSSLPGGAADAPPPPASLPEWSARLPARAVSSALRRGYVEVEGAPLHYLAGGSDGPAPLVVQHDAASSVGTVRPIVEDLARTRRVYAFDMPGSGDSVDTLPPDPVPIEVYAERIAGAIDALGLPCVDFYGMWGGGFVGLELARLHPGRVRRLVLSNLFFHDGEERMRFQRSYTPSVAPLWHGGHLLQAWHQMRDQGLFYPWFDTTAAGVLRREPFIATWMVHERVCSLLKAGDRYRSAYQAHFVYPTLARLAAVQVPTLVATSEWDPNRPHTEAAAAANPHCEFRLLDPDFRRWGSSFASFLDR